MCRKINFRHYEFIVYMTFGIKFYFHLYNIEALHINIKVEKKMMP